MSFPRSRNIPLIITICTILLTAPFSGCTDDGSNTNKIKADFSIAPEKILKSQAVQLDASLTKYGGAKGKLRYNWNFGDNETGTGSPISHTYKTDGQFTITLTVTDGKREDTVSKDVRVINIAPTIDSTTPAGTSIETIEKHLTVFEVSVSDENDIDLYYQWELDDEIVSNGTGKFNYIPDYNSSGEHCLRFVVSDGSASDEVSWKINVIDLPREPHSVSWVNGTIFTTGMDIEFIGGNSWDPDNQTLRYEWDFGDGEGATDENPVHRFDEIGHYVVNLTVSDGSLTNTSLINIDIISPIFERWRMGPYAEEVHEMEVVDVDADGENELVIGYSGEWSDEDYSGGVIVIDLATQVTEWSNTDTGSVWEMVIQNIDDDPQMEIILGIITGGLVTKTKRFDFHGHAMALDGSSGTVQWRTDDIGMVETLGVGDTDGDGAVEVAVGFGNVTIIPDTIHDPVLDHGGLLVVGSNGDVEWMSGDYGETHVIGVENLDKTGPMEIVVLRSYGWRDVPLTNLSVVKWDGGGYFISNEWNDSGLNDGDILDIEGDGTLEIVASYSVSSGTSASGTLYVFDRNLNIRWSKDLWGEVRDIIVSDIDGDKKMEIIIGLYEGQFVGPNYNEFKGGVLVLDTFGNKEWSNSTCDPRFMGVGDILGIGTDMLVVVGKCISSSNDDPGKIQVFEGKRGHLVTYTNITFRPLIQRGAMGDFSGEYYENLLLVGIYQGDEFVYRYS